jgi:hypothetical protein
LFYTSPSYARVVKSVDTRDLKSLDRKVVPVQVWLRAPFFTLFSSLIKKKQLHPTVYFLPQYCSLSFKLTTAICVRGKSIYANVGQIGQGVMCGRK